MSFPKGIFKIVKENDCPLYKLGDEFKLSGKALLVDHKMEETFFSTTVIKLPPGKRPCHILFGNISKILIKYESMDNIPSKIFHCGGCTGFAKLSYRKEKKYVPHTGTDSKSVRIMEKVLNQLSIFQSVDKTKLKQFIPFLKIKKYKAGQYILRKGEAGKNLYIIVLGNVQVLDSGGNTIAALGKGEVFGEMSLLSGEPVGASIQASTPVTALSINGSDLRKILLRFPTLQMYFAQLLAKRLTKSNIERSEEYSSGMVGKLSEMQPPELFQTLNVNQKTGVLTLKLSEGLGKVYFKEGNLVGAKYGNLQDKEAFFELLKQQKGRFQFVPGLSQNEMALPELGDFMWLIMEGLNRIDEEESA